MTFYQEVVLIFLTQNLVLEKFNTAILTGTQKLPHLRAAISLITLYIKSMFLKSVIQKLIMLANETQNH